MSDSRLKRFASPVGDLIVAADARGVLMCEFADGRNVDRAVERLPAIATNDAVLDQLRGELAEYFSGDRTAFTVPLPAMGTAFQQSAWQQLVAIPFGETRSYAKQAMAVGNPRAVRAVARANGSNFRCIVIPCHRVIGADGTLTGFGGGLPRKQWLLDHERRASASRLASADVSRVV